MKHTVQLFWFLVASTLVLFAFQNCGRSAFNNEDLVLDQPLSSIEGEQTDIKHTKYEGGSPFKALSFENNISKNKLSVQQIENQESYEVKTSETSVVCKEDSEALVLKSFLSFSNDVYVTHPSMLNETPDLCARNSNKREHISIGNPESVVLILKNQDEDCLMDDPFQLLGEGKRVFIVNNLSQEDLNLRIEEAQNLMSSSSCFDQITED